MTALGSTSGCVRRLRSIVNRESAETVSLTVTAPPADSDRLATLIARHIVSNLEAVGISTTLNVLPQSELLRAVLLNQDFELFVSRLPPVTDPHDYRSLLHSEFVGEAGWQNPYGFADLVADDHIDRQQRTAGDDRRASVAELTGHITRTQPFTTIAFPDEIRAFRTDRFTGWERRGVTRPFAYLALERADGVPPTEALTLELATTDARVTQNLNPIAVEYRLPRPFTDLLYDPLARRFDDGLAPWLAAEWTFDAGADRSTITASLRPGIRWHDGVSITADDVAFTFRFLSDTSLDELEQRVPAPLFRAWTSIVSEARAVDDGTVELTVETTSEPVATQTLQTPILPEHVWRDQRSVADISGFERSDSITDALVWANLEAVGSGPMVVDSVADDEEVVFQPFEGYFLRDAGPLPGVPDRFTGEPPFDELRIRALPSNETSVELVAQGELDGTATAVDPREEILERIASVPELSMVVERSDSPYHVGYNTATKPFSNPYFRRLVARLIDKQHVVDTIFRGYGTAASHPLDGTQWGPTELAFDGTDPAVPFLGTDGEVDTDQARDVFRTRGFEFDESGTLLLR